MLPCFYAGRALLGEGDILQVSWKMVTKRMLHHSLFTLQLTQGRVLAMLLHFFSYCGAMTTHVEGYVRSVQTPYSGINRYQSARS